MAQERLIASSTVRKSVAAQALRGKRSLSEQRFSGVVQHLFPSHLVLLPQVRQTYELDLAFGEYQRLAEAELIRRAAYFKSVRGALTWHYRVCMNTPNQVNASAHADRKNFFAANVFGVGYATHGLFPYRGKFHPQMIKGIINLMGVREGETILDPMAGCGTTAIEASIMGINSTAVELSPFPCLMSRAKVGVLETDCSSFPAILSKADRVFDAFARQRRIVPGRTTLFDEEGGFLVGAEGNEALAELSEPMRELLLLCFLDCMGYAQRQTRKTARQLFPEVLERYLAAVQAFNASREELGLRLGKTRVVNGDARDLSVPDESVDGIVFSPPYSFAIDYLENDRPQLEFMGVDVAELKTNMVGLIGTGRTREQFIRSRVENYFSDMERILRHCHRVLKPGRSCVIVVGSNTNQTGGISLEEELVRIGERVGMALEFQIVRQIEGIRNTMRDEYLLFFRKS